MVSLFTKTKAVTINDFIDIINQLETCVDDNGIHRFSDFSQTVEYRGNQYVVGADKNGLYIKSKGFYQKRSYLGTDALEKFPEQNDILNHIFLNKHIVKAANNVGVKSQLLAFHLNINPKCSTQLYQELSSTCLTKTTSVLKHLTEERIKSLLQESTPKIAAQIIQNLSKLAIDLPAKYFELATQGCQEVELQENQDEEFKGLTVLGEKDWARKAPLRKKEIFKECNQDCAAKILLAESDSERIVEMLSYRSDASDVFLNMLELIDKSPQSYKGQINHHLKAIAESSKELANTIMSKIGVNQLIVVLKADAEDFKLTHLLRPDCINSEYLCDALIEVPQRCLIKYFDRLSLDLQQKVVMTVDRGDRRKGVCLFEHCCSKLNDPEQKAAFLMALSTQCIKFCHSQVFELVKSPLVKKAFWDAQSSGKMINCLQQLSPQFFEALCEYQGDVRTDSKQIECLSHFESGQKLLRFHLKTDSTRWFAAINNLDVEEQFMCCYRIGFDICREYILSKTADEKAKGLVTICKTDISDRTKRLWARELTDNAKDRTMIEQLMLCSSEDLACVVSIIHDSYHALLFIGHLESDAKYRKVLEAVKPKSVALKIARTALSANYTIERRHPAYRTMGGSPEFVQEVFSGLEK